MEGAEESIFQGMPRNFPGYRPATGVTCPWGCIGKIAFGISPPWKFSKNINLQTPRFPYINKTDERFPKRIVLTCRIW